ncbi:MAG: hypothetical protein CMI90_06590 [Pelagibacteraceae bacterium]|nr:hypothetical protein [Pelagibacteraceae bacterium]
MKDPIFSRLLELHPKFSDLSLIRIKKLLKKLKFDENKLPNIIHIAGTNGKGSTASIIKSILNQHNLTTHIYTTPHLVKFNERIQLYSNNISDKLLLHYLYLCEKINDGKLITYFEITTAAALIAYQDHPADYLILEVGLGGRFDATNIISKKKYAAITPISLDHQEYLGNSLTKIAYEKLNIFNKKSINFINYQKPTVKEYADEFIKKNNIKAKKAGVDWEVKNTLYIDNKHSINLKSLSLKGYYQYENAGLAIALGKKILGKNFDIKLIQKALKKVHWPGRFQKITKGKLKTKIKKSESIYLDGFHNIDGAKAFIKNLNNKNSYLVCSFLNNKKFQAILGLLQPHFKKIFVVPMNEANSIQKDDIKKTKTILMAKNISDSITKINIHSENNSYVYFGGSLYFIGEVLKFNQKS